MDTSQHNKPSTSSSTPASAPSPPSKPKSPAVATTPPRWRRWLCRRRIHMTGGGVWCLWYSVSVAFFTAYLVYRGVRRFLAAASLPWPEDEAPYVALNAYVGLVGAAVVVTPFLLLTALHKVGNLANDGVQLGRSLSTCSADPPVLPLPTPGIVRMIWTHGPPTAAFLHLLSAFCLLLPHTLLDAQLLHAGLLPKTEIWSTDLDLFVPHEDRLAVLATLQPPPRTVLPPNTPLTTPTVPHLNPVVPSGERSLYPRAADASSLRSAAMLRVADKKPYEHKVGEPTADYLKNGWNSASMDNRKKFNYNRTDVHNTSGGRYSSSPILGQLPVGAIVPLSTLGMNIPPSVLSFKDVSGQQFLPSNLQLGDVLRGGGIEKRREGNLATLALQENNGSVPLGRGLTWRPVSPEFLNFVAALLLYAIRYPGVFWSSNKAFSVLFSLQMVIAGAQTVLLTCAFTILYKLHLMGGVQELHGPDQLLLSLPVTVVLFVVSVLLLSLSCAAVYLHGYHKFVHFVVRSRQRYQITYSEEPVPVDAYSGHVAGMLLLVLLCVCSGPLVWDLSRVYRGSLDRVVLIAVISTIVHIFAWIALWLLLTVKSRWSFKLRVTVARACVASARSIKLVNDVELRQGEEAAGGSFAPLLVVGGGRAFAVPEAGHKKAIMCVVQKSESVQAEGDSTVYWHRPTPPTLSPRPSRPHNRGADASNSKSGTSTDSNGGKRSSVKHQQPLSESEDDAGDYALLLEEGGIIGSKGHFSSSPLQSPVSRGGDRQQHRLTRASSTSAADARYVDRRQILEYRRQNEQLQQQFKQEHHHNQQQQQQDEERCDGAAEEDSDGMPPLPPPPPGLGGPHDAQDASTPRSTRSPDSGLVVHEDPAIHRSDSASTSTSSTATNHQPDQSTSSTNTATNHSEHSEPRTRCGSEEDLSQLPADPSNFPSYPRPLRSQSLVGSSGTSLYNDSTVVIRRQRNLTRELQPPIDPIYGSRSITSFKEEGLYGGVVVGSSRGGCGSGMDFIKEERLYVRNSGGDTKGSVKMSDVCPDDVLARAQNSMNNQQYGGSGSTSSGGSAGYHTASNSSGSNSPVPPPSATPGLATPPPPMPPLYPHHKPMLGHHSIYGHTSRIYGQTAPSGHPIYGHTGVHHSIYGRTGQGKLPQAPQIPLPPIPQGSIPPSLHYGATQNNGDNDFPPPPLSSPSPLSPPPGDLYPGEGSHQAASSSRFAGGGVGGSGGRVVCVGRSSSLRFAPGTPPRHFTNSLPHVLPRSMHYNTGV